MHTHTYIHILKQARCINNYLNPFHAGGGTGRFGPAQYVALGCSILGSNLSPGGQRGSGRLSSARRRGRTPQRKGRE